jgi:ABC-2 type transport system ATP-binding protein
MGIIASHSLTKRYGGTDAVSNLNLEILPGEVFGFLGPNGVGKTTTIRLLLGLIKPTSGEAEIFGLNCQTETKKIHQRLAYVPREANIWDSLTGRQTLKFLSSLHGKIDESYQRELIEKFAFDPSKKVRAYSKGNRQKLLLISGLSTRADVLLLDEPTSGLDPLMQEVFRSEILAAKKLGQTIFLSSHTLSEVEILCDRIGLLRSGELIEIGTLEQMRHLSALTYQITFADAPLDLHAISGVSRILVEGVRVTCEVSGDPQELLTALSKTKITKLVSHEATLEEIFLSHYGK